MKIINEGYLIETELNGEEILKHIEKCGRTCYKSEGKITDDSAKTMIKMLIGNGHESVLEHFSFSVRFINDRGVSHEEVRHRIASVSQESTRYCNYSNDKFNSGITYIDLSNGISLDTKMRNMSVDDVNFILLEWHDACEDAERHYLKMLELGATPQIARSVLNNSTKTEIVITANLREWRTILKQRTAKAAHPQIRFVMIPLLAELKNLIPVVFDDITVDDVIAEVK
jgi:thymidylate synthase (FAD)